MTDREPVERKVQLSGGSTYTISLPREWITRHQIESGTPLHIYDHEERLVMIPKAANEERRIVRVSAQDYNSEDLALHVMAAYVVGCEDIVVEGQPDQRQRRAVRDALRGLIGIEVHAETETELVARTMLRVDDLSPKQTLAQIKQLALVMHEDAVRAVLTDDADLGRRVQNRDDEVDRLFGLVCREFHLSLTTLQVSRESSGPSTFEYYTAARQFERIADHAEKIAGVAVRANSTPPEAFLDDFDELAGRARTIVSRACSGLLEDGEDLTGVVADGQGLVEDATAVDRELYQQAIEQGYFLGTVLDSIIRTTEYGVNIAEAGLQASMRTTSQQ